MVVLCSVTQQVCFVSFLTDRIIFISVYLDRAKSSLPGKGTS